MAAYWKLPCEELWGIEGGDPDAGPYDVDYAKEILYGQVITTINGCEFFFHLPFDDESDLTVFAVIQILYAVRKLFFCNNRQM